MQQVKNPNWQEANQLAIYMRGRGRGLNLGPPDFKSGALIHWAGLEINFFCSGDSWRLRGKIWSPDHKF